MSTEKPKRRDAMRPLVKTSERVNHHDAANHIDMDLENALRHQFEEHCFECSTRNGYEPSDLVNDMCDMLREVNLGSEAEENQILSAVRDAKIRELT